MKATTTIGWTLTLVAAGALPASADVLVVDQGGGGDFTEIQAAVDVALDGDTLLVRTGLYAGFTIAGQDLCVVEEEGAVAIVSGQVRVMATLADQVVLLEGLRIQSLNVGDDTVQDALLLQETRGAVRLEDCDLRGADGIDYSRVERGGDGVHATNAHDLSIVRCSLSGGSGGMSFTGFEKNRGGDGLRALRSRVAVHDSLVIGGPGGPGDFLGCDFGGDGGHGARLTGSFFFGSGSSFLGGDGGGDDFLACRPGGNGLYLIGVQTQGHLLDLFLQGGLGACGAPDGLPVATEGGATATMIAGTARRFAPPNPVRESTLVDIVFEGQPGDEAFLLLSNAPQLAWMPSLNGVLLLDLPLAQGRRFLGTIPAGGVLIKTVLIPALAPGEEATTLFLQALFQDPGSGAWLASPSTLVVVDDAF